MTAEEITRFPYNHTLKAKMAIILGIAISPLKISAIVHTAETVM